MSDAFLSRDQILELLRELGDDLNRQELARRSGTSRAAIHSYETGTVSPSLHTTQRILTAIGYTLTVRAFKPEMDAPAAELTSPR